MKMAPIAISNRINDLVISPFRIAQPQLNRPGHCAEELSERPAMTTKAANAACLIASETSLLLSNGPVLVARVVLKIDIVAIGLQPTQCWFVPFNHSFQMGIS